MSKFCGFSVTQRRDNRWKQWLQDSQNVFKNGDAFCISP